MTTRADGLALIAKRIGQRPYVVVTKPGAVNPVALQNARQHSVFIYVPMLDDQLAVWMFDNAPDMIWFRDGWAKDHAITEYPAWLATVLIVTSSYKD